MIMGLNTKEKRVRERQRETTSFRKEEIHKRERLLFQFKKGFVESK